MAAVYACSRIGNERPKERGSAVCFVLDSAHASHTLRVFLRDQGPGMMLHPITAEDAWRFVELAPNNDPDEAGLEKATD